MLQTTTVPDNHIASAVDHALRDADALPISPTIPHESKSSAAQSPLPQTTTVPDDHIPSAVEHAAHNADTVESPAGLETGIAIVDTKAGSVSQVQSALEYAESLKGTLGYLEECAGYLDGVIGLVKDFADVCLLFCRCLIDIQFSHQIHPISKIAVGAVTKAYEVSSTSWTRLKFSSSNLWYQLVKKQGDRNESIHALASCMRDMLESLSEVKDLGKIMVLRSVIKIAVTRVDECAKFIESYAQHGFWGGFAHSPAVTCLIEN
jgi:hypothetical protein